MPNDIGKATDILKKILADDETKGKITGIMNEIIGSEQTDAVDEEEYAEILDADEEEENGKLDVSSLLPSLLGNIDISTIYETLAGGNDKRINLLSALKPYLSDRRSVKIEKAIQVVQIAGISSTLGIDKIFKA